MSEVEVQTDPMQERESETIVYEALPPLPSPNTPRKKSKVWMGNFLDLFTSKPM